MRFDFVSGDARGGAQGPPHRLDLCTAHLAPPPPLLLAQCSMLSPLMTSKALLGRHLPYPDAISLGVMQKDANTERC